MAVNVWQYIVAPTGASLGHVAVSAILFGVLVALTGIALITVPGELARIKAQRVSSEKRHTDLEERRLKAEMFSKMGAVLITWSVAMLLALLLRFAGTPGLDTRFLAALVVIALPLLVGYSIIYGLFFYPRYLRVSRVIDTQKSYERVAVKNTKPATKMIRKEKVQLMPVKATIGLIVLPLIYYFAMIVVSIPPGVAPQNHDHLLHQGGMLVMVPLGYLLGLLLSLGDEIRPLLPWVRVAQKR